MATPRRCAACSTRVLTSFAAACGTRIRPTVLPTRLGGLAPSTRGFHHATVRLLSGTTPQSSNNTATEATAEAPVVPWFLRVETPKAPRHPLAERQVIPELPENPPPELAKMLHQLSEEHGITDLNLLDLRPLDPPPAIGNMVMLVGTARSLRHLHTTADKVCRFMRSELKWSPYADGLLGRNELKLINRRKQRRGKVVSTQMGEVDETGSAGWVCVHGGGEQTIIVQLFTQAKREEMDIDGLWRGILNRYDRHRNAQAARQAAREARWAEEDLRMAREEGEVVGFSAEGVITRVDGEAAEVSAENPEAQAESETAEVSAENPEAQAEGETAEVSAEKPEAQAEGETAEVSAEKPEAQAEGETAEVSAKKPEAQADGETAEVSAERPKAQAEGETAEVSAKEPEAQAEGETAEVSAERPKAQAEGETAEVSAEKPKAQAEGEAAEVSAEEPEAGTGSGTAGVSAENLEAQAEGETAEVPAEEPGTQGRKEAAGVSAKAAEAQEEKEAAEVSTEEAVEKQAIEASVEEIQPVLAQYNTVPSVSGPVVQARSLHQLTAPAPEVAASVDVTSHPSFPDFVRTGDLSDYLSTLSSPTEDSRSAVMLQAHINALKSPLVLPAGLLGSGFGDQSSTAFLRTFYGALSSASPSVQVKYELELILLSNTYKPELYPIGHFFGVLQGLRKRGKPVKAEHYYLVLSHLASCLELRPPNPAGWQDAAYARLALIDLYIQDLKSQLSPEEAADVEYRPEFRYAAFSALMKCPISSVRQAIIDHDSLPGTPLDLGLPEIMLPFTFHPKVLRSRGGYDSLSSSSSNSSTARSYRYTLKQHHLDMMTALGLAKKWDQLWDLWKRLPLHGVSRSVEYYKLAYGLVVLANNQSVAIYCARWLGLDSMARESPRVPLAENPSLANAFVRVLDIADGGQNSSEWALPRRVCVHVAEKETQ